jgi:hypothetical protein
MTWHIIGALEMKGVVGTVTVTETEGYVGEIGRANIFNE